MKKRYIFLFISLCLVIGGAILIKKDYTKDHEFIQETKEDLQEQKVQQDSLFNLADEVLEKVVINQEENKSAIDELDQQVKNKEITIEQQVLKLKKLLKEANDAKKLAQEHEEMAIQIKQQADLAKMKAEEQQKEALVAYEKLQNKYDSLLVKYNEILDNVNKEFNSFIDEESLEGGDILNIEDKKDKKDKKKKKND